MTEDVTNIPKEALIFFEAKGYGDPYDEANKEKFERFFKRFHTAYQFLLSHNYHKNSIHSHLSNINFERAVQIKTLIDKDRVYQSQSLSDRQGSYYTPILIAGKDAAQYHNLWKNKSDGDKSEKVEEKVNALVYKRYYCVNKPTDALMFTVRDDIDPWSKDKPITIPGGQKQLFSPQKENFTAINLRETAEEAPSKPKRFGR